MKIKLFVTCEIQYFELGIFSFNLYVYYLSHGFIASTHAFNLLTPAFNLLAPGFNLPTRAFNHATRTFSLLTRGFELASRAFELVTRNSCFTFPLINLVKNIFFLRFTWWINFVIPKVRRKTDFCFCWPSVLGPICRLSSPRIPGPKTFLSAFFDFLRICAKKCSCEALMMHKRECSIHKY